uniref:Putative secreted protein n=1 Tax=Ixodes ricinus TaxID=34613 RepID=A0A6B0TWE1_IXORI
MSTQHFFLVLLVSRILALGMSPGTLVRRVARTFWHTALQALLHFLVNRYIGCSDAMNKTTPLPLADIASQRHNYMYKFDG